MIPEVERTIHENHRSYDTLEEALRWLRYRLRNAKQNKTWERDKTLSVFTCGLYRELGQHYHIGHQRT